VDTKVYRRERFHKDTVDEGCTVNLTVRYIARKWTLLILLELYKGEGHTRRFTELKSCLDGITQKVLSARLKELEKEGLIENKVDRTSFPVKSKYTLTESGQEIINIVKDMKRWALKWKIENIKCSNQDCSECVL
jgi:DNA-binding HxlR family transcriptional regulator